MTPFCIISPIHERGHYLACLALGIQVTKVEWGRVYYHPSSDWKINMVMRFSGSFFAALILCIGYALFSKFVMLNPNRKSRSNTVILIVRTILMAGVIEELVFGFLEGAVFSFYMQTAEPLLAIVFSLFFVGFSYEIHRRIARKSGVFTAKSNELEQDTHNKLKQTTKSR